MTCTHFLIARLVPDVLANRYVYRDFGQVYVPSDDSQVIFVHEPALKQLANLCAFLLVERYAEYPACGKIQSVYKVKLVGQLVVGQARKLMP